MGTHETVGVREAAAAMGLSVEAMRKRLARGSIPGFKDANGEWRVLLGIHGDPPPGSQYPDPQPVPPQYPHAAPPKPRPSGRASAALALGILSWIVGAFLIGPLLVAFAGALVGVSVALGHMALRDIGRSNGRLTGRRLALLALFFGYIQAINVLFVIYTMLRPPSF